MQLLVHIEGLCGPWVPGFFCFLYLWRLCRCRSQKKTVIKKTPLHWIHIYIRIRIRGKRILYRFEMNINISWYTTYYLWYVPDRMTPVVILWPLVLAGWKSTIEGHSHLDYIQVYIYMSKTGHLDHTQLFEHNSSTEALIYTTVDGPWLEERCQSA